MNYLEKCSNHISTALKREIPTDGSIIICRYDELTNLYYILCNGKRFLAYSINEKVHPAIKEFHNHWDATITLKESRSQFRAFFVSDNSNLFESIINQRY